MDLLCCHNGRRTSKLLNPNAPGFKLPQNGQPPELDVLLHVIKAEIPSAGSGMLGSNLWAEVTWDGSQEAAWLVSRTRTRWLSSGNPEWLHECPRQPIAAARKGQDARVTFEILEDSFMVGDPTPLGAAEIPAESLIEKADGSSAAGMQKLPLYQGGDQIGTITICVSFVEREQFPSLAAARRATLAASVHSDRLRMSVQRTNSSLTGTSLSSSSTQNSDEEGDPGSPMNGLINAWTKAVNAAAAAPDQASQEKTPSARAVQSRGAVLRHTPFGPAEGGASANTPASSSSSPIGKAHGDHRPDAAHGYRTPTVKCSEAQSFHGPAARDKDAARQALGLQGPAKQRAYTGEERVSRSPMASPRASPSPSPKGSRAGHDPLAARVETARRRLTQKLEAPFMEDADKGYEQITERTPEAIQARAILEAVKGKGPEKEQSRPTQASHASPSALAKRLRVTARKYPKRGGGWLQASKERFFAVLKDSGDGDHDPSAALAWYDDKASWKAGRKPLGSLPLARVRGAEVDRKNGNSGAGISVTFDADPEGNDEKGSMYVVFASPQAAEDWCNDLNQLLDLMRER